MVKRTRRMSESDMKSIISELDRWALGQLGTKLSYKVLAKSVGFSRQTLQAKSEIKAAFDNAKAALRGGLVKSKEMTSIENDELICELQRIKLELEEYKHKEVLWMQRWQRIAFHLRQKGTQVSDVDKPIPDGGDKPTERQTANVLRPFDKDIPPSGRV